MPGSAMRLVSVPPMQGAQWVRGGLRVFFKAPVAYSSLYVLVLLGFALLQSLPWLGQAVTALLMPSVCVGLVLASEAVEAGRIPTPGLVIRALRRSPQATIAMLQLGVVVLVTTSACALIANVLDPDFAVHLSEWFRSAQDAAQGAPPSPQAEAGLRSGMLLRLALMVPTSLLLWHAPVLLDRSGGSMSVGKAIFASAVACWRNKGAFTVYALTWLLAMAAAAAAAMTLFTLLGRPQLAAPVLVPISFIFSTAMCASLYFTVMDCFDFDDSHAGTEPAAPL